jgi:hypothetical protein
VTKIKKAKVMSELNKLGTILTSLEVLGVKIYIKDNPDHHVDTILTRNLPRDEVKNIIGDVIFLLPSMARQKKHWRIAGESGVFKLDEVDFKVSIQQLDEKDRNTFGDLIQFIDTSGDGVLTNVGILPLLRELHLWIDGFTRLKVVR